MMKDFKDYISEQKKYPPRLKGWGNVKTGKLLLTPIRGKEKPYHQEFASNNLSKFGLKEKDAITYIDDSYMPPDEDDSKKLFQDIQSGKIDRDKAFEEFLNNGGWHSIVIDEGTSSIGDYKGDLRKYHKIAVAIHKKYGDSMFQDSSDFFEVGTENIHNKYDWNNYIKTKKIGRGRTEIGTTMAMFRGEERMKSFREFMTEKTYAKSGLGKWFNQQSAGGGPGWDRYGTDGKKLGKCGDAKEGEPYSACLSKQKADKLGKEKIASFVRRKRYAQDKAKRGDVGDGGKGKKPINVKTGVTDKDPKKRGIQDAVKVRVDSDLEVLVVQDKEGNAKVYSSIEDAKKKAKEISGKIIYGSDGEILVQVLKDPSLRKQGVMQEEKNPRIPRKKGQPANSKQHSDLYTDENPEGTIHGLGFKDVETSKASVAKIKRSDRTHAHKIQAAIAMEQRAKEMGKKAEAAVYRKYIEQMKKKTKEMNKEDWSDKYKKSIDCNNPKGFSQRAHCASREKNEESTMKSFKDYIEEKNVPNNPELWKKAIAKAKAKFDVYPSAYANAWAAKWYKGEGGTWSVKKESVELEDGKYVTVKQFVSDEAAQSAINDAEGLIDSTEIMSGVFTMVFDSEESKEQFIIKHKNDIKESVELDEAWTPDSVKKNAEIGSKNGYGITIKKTGGITKTPYKHMLMTTQRHGNVRVTFDHGKEEFEGTPQSVAIYLNKLLGIKESVDECSCGCNSCDDVNEAEYQGRTVTLNNPFRLPQGSKKKFGVYVKNDKGNVVKVTFGDPNMEIKRDDPERLKAFRSRHNCDQKTDKTTPGYWSCYQWREGEKVDN
tara:strand:- start:7369 stop:9843 length:2475 start_codon:yes stop_codon:yes gene_type:complete